MLTTLYFVSVILGIIFAIHAVLYSRTTQAALAWGISLISFPIVSLPFYLIFGFRKFRGYKKIQKINENRKENFSIPQKSCLDSGGPYKLKVLEELADASFTDSNDVELLINGESAFKRIFDELDHAKSYVLVQFYIVRNDKIGNKMKDKLIELARRDVRVHFIIDEIGSYELDGEYVDALKAEGVNVAYFSTTIRKSNRFQINFRNHRKIVVVDGHTAFVGGINLGDEYINDNSQKIYWRDTHLRLSGSSVVQVQTGFMEDWFWVTDQLLNLKVQAIPCSGNNRVLVLNSGPADRLEKYEMSFVHLINEANTRIWLATPYFVPDYQIMTSLKLARLRGVEVCLIVPENSDNIFVDYASRHFISECIDFGVKVFAFDKGFMHQKVILIDHSIATVGSANIDNRSFYLNFEATVFVNNEYFNSQVEKMLNADISISKQLTVEDFSKLELFPRLMGKLSRLLAPIL